MKPDYYCKEREVFTMAFVKKTWKDRIAEFPTRRRLTKEDNTSELVTVAREEGTLSQEGDAFSAENMNDLENRIDAEFTEVNGKLQWTVADSWSDAVANAQNESTFLYAPVEIITKYHVYNINAHHFENAIQRVFSDKNLDVEIVANNGRLIVPREWFIVELDEIEDTINKIVTTINYI